MCGILASFGIGSQEIFSKSLELLRHRGPDGYGLWNDSQCMLGHRRLAIQDLSSAGAQPMHYERRHIVFNGEIYNHAEIRSDLIKAGEYFVSRSDTEVLLKAYVRWGISSLERLNGVWSFVIWDEYKGVFVVSRDRLGEKPLYQTEVGNRILFASEQKALLVFQNEVRARKDFKKLAKNHYLYEGRDLTLFDNIKGFPPGKVAIYSSKGVRTIDYWKPEIDGQVYENSLEENADRLEELLVDSCRLRGMSDATACTTLSGGLDSSIVTAGTSKTGARRLEAFNYSFKGNTIDESTQAEFTSKSLGVELTKVSQSWSSVNVGRLIEKAYFHLENVHEVIPLPHVMLYNSVRESGYKVTLDGHGGDELFGGYESAVLSAIPSRLNSISQVKDLLRLYGSMSQNNDDFPVAGVSRVALMVIQQLWQVGRRSRKDIDHSFRDSLGRYLYFLTRTSILPTLLRNYDRYSMMNSVEIRMPLLDHRIVELALSLPGSQKIDRTATKVLLRKVGYRMLDSRIVDRKAKVGFAPPVLGWLRSPVGAYILDEVSSEAAKGSQLVDGRKLKGDLEGLISGESYEGQYKAERIMRDFSILLWEKNFLRGHVYDRYKYLWPEGGV